MGRDHQKRRGWGEEEQPVMEMKREKDNSRVWVMKVR
jgi:hypothetical protein